ncbi:hypothetical protein F5Y01DRAFT_240490 [Xylaria sp. FL0043]|nr:hypothetical protein F5Y01DRAFT_240490 [Xylaria sp. FL0043]
MYPTTLHGSSGTRRDLDGSDLMAVLLRFFCNDDDQQTPRAALGSSKPQKFVAGLGALPHGGESDSGPRSSQARPPAHRSLARSPSRSGQRPIPPLLPPPRQLQASRRPGRGAKSSAKRPVGRSPMRLDGSSGRRWWVWMTRVPGWLGPKLYRFGGRRACSNCVFPARARGGSEQDRMLVASYRRQSHRSPPAAHQNSSQTLLTHCAACWLGPCCTLVLLGGFPAATVLRSGAPCRLLQRHPCLGAERGNTVLCPKSLHIRTEPAGGPARGTTMILCRSSL